MARQVEDLTNRKFGILTVVEKVMIDNRTHWKCKCDCGGEKITEAYLLKNGSVRTCGCRSSYVESHKKSLKKYRVDGTYTPAIRTDKVINHNNTSGYTGVTYRKDREKWAAYMTFQRKRIFLGHYDNKEDAIKARKIAEEKYFGKYNKDTDKQNENLIGKRFGMLTVVEKVLVSGRTQWLCKCDCGREKITWTHLLKKGEIKTCGCRINRPLNKNNTSGYRGVSYCKDREKWMAQIKYQGKNISLGRYDNIEDAIKVRKEAEEKYFGKILDEKNKHLKE